MRMAYCDLYMTFQARLAIALVWKVQFHKFDHFYIGCKELFHMVHLNQECFSTQIWTLSYHGLISMQMASCDLFKFD